MFQYACGYSLAKRNGTEFRMDLNPFSTYKAWKYQLDLFNIEAPKATKEELKSVSHFSDTALFRTGNRLLKRILRTQLSFSNPYHYNEKWPTFHEDLLSLNETRYLVGYWQSEGYFEDSADLIRTQFTLKTPLSEKNLEVLLKIKSSRCSVSLHVRRGDYVSSAQIMNIHGTPGVEYYSRAIKHIRDLFPESEFFVFSDDLNWVKENITIPSATYVDVNSGESGIFDLELMKNCHHNIIANSTFSWWAAWLNPNKDKLIIMPKLWMNDPSNCPERIHIRGALQF